MLKMLKYELIRMFRNYSYVFIIYLALSFLLPFISNGQSYQVTGWAVSIIVFMIIGISISVYISIIVDFWRSMFGKVGYLTLTLPRSNGEILLTKLMTAIIWMTFTSLMIILGLFLMVLGTGVLSGINLFSLFSDLSDLIKIIFSDISKAIGITVLYIISVTILQIMIFYTCMSISNTKIVRNHRLVIAIIFFFVINWCYSFARISLGIDSGNIFDLTNYMWSEIAANTVITMISFFVCVYILDNHLEMDS